MQNILVLADGPIAKQFVDRIVNVPNHENHYYIVHYRECVLPPKRPSNCKFEEFDPTSPSKLLRLMQSVGDLHQAFIIMKTKDDTIESYRNIRHEKGQMPIIVLGAWEKVYKEDPYLSFIDSNEVLANRLFDHLPNVPVIAQNVGTGEGEIMEVQVPIGSSYVYKHIGSIEKHEWQIAALYRKGKQRLVTINTMIHPNDTLLLVGNPRVLDSVFRDIKKQLGSFPAPYGDRIFLFVDMLHGDQKRRDQDVEDALFLQEKLEKKLIVYVINPTDIAFIGNLKEKSIEHDFTLIVNYEAKTFGAIASFITLQNVGLVVVNNYFLNKRRTRGELHSLRLPILSLGEKPLSDVNAMISVLKNSLKMETIATAMYDMSSQLSLNLELINPLESETASHIIEHYENLSNIFSQNLSITQDDLNPVRYIQAKREAIIALPFDSMITKPQLLSLFSTDPHALYYMYLQNHQLFIPVEANPS
jgi:hypothetical protein